jgi:hypothetical protein
MNWWSVEGPEWEDAMTKVPSRYSRLARAVIAMFVFGVGMLGGVGVAALDGRDRAADCGGLSVI